MNQIHMAYPHLPIVVLSGDQDESLALKALEQGAKDHLRKGEADGRNLVRAFGMQLHGTGHDRLVEGAEFFYCASSGLG
jgi:DNA-binding NarL/FixJ family response regulator